VYTIVFLNVLVFVLRQPETSWAFLHERGGRGWRGHGYQI